MSALIELIKQAKVSRNQTFLEHVCHDVSDDMLEEIANADYGADYDAHLSALRRLRARRDLDKQLLWEPREVLELFRWSEFGDNRTGQKPRSEATFHLMRAFCCALLLEAHVNKANEGYFDGSNQTLIQLLDSALYLEPQVQHMLPEFVAWLTVQTDFHEEERAYFGLALIASMIREKQVSGTSADLIVSIIAACQAEFDVVRATWPESVGRLGDRWLLGWTFFDQRHAKWLDLAIELDQAARLFSDAELRTQVQILARWLTVDGAWRE